MHIPPMSELRVQAQVNFPRAVLLSLEAEILKNLDWNINRPTSLDFIAMFKSQGLIFTSDTIKGVALVSDSNKISKSCYALIDEYMKEVLLGK